MSKPGYAIVPLPKNHPSRRERYDRDYNFAIVEPPNEDGVRYVVSKSYAAGGLTTLCKQLNEAYDLGYRAGLQHNEAVATEDG